MSVVLALASRSRIKPSHRRRRKAASAHLVYIGNNPLSGRDPTGYACTGSNIDRHDGSSCAGQGVSGGGYNSSPLDGKVVHTDGGGAYRAHVSSSGVVSFEQLHKENGAKGQGILSADKTDGSANGASGIDSLERDPGQAQLHDVANTGNAIADGFYTGLNALVPQNATDVAIMAGTGPLLRLGGKALSLSGELAGDSLGVALNGIEDATKLRMASREAELTGVGASGETFRSFTSGNFRENLSRLTGGIPEGAQAHHIFPQASEFADKFERLGINVHDPYFGAWWNGGAHNAASGEYNAAWRGFFRDGPRSTGETFDFARDQASRNGYQVQF